MVKNSSAAKVAVLEYAKSYFTHIDVIDRIETMQMLRYKERDGLHGRPMTQRGIK